MDALFLVLIVVGVIIFCQSSHKQGKSVPYNQQSEFQQPKEEQKVDYSKSYQTKYLLTKNEWLEYKKLKELAGQKGLQICPKVRLADIIEPRNGKYYQTNFNKIKAKHVDFVITDPNLYIKAVIELDDNSHNTAERKVRDEFVDQILTSVGYRVIHTRTITEETLKDI